MSAQHVTQNKVLINHMWEGARVCLWQQFHASLERLATKTDILTSTVRIRRWQSQSWHEENLRSYEKAMATSLGGCWAGWANMERWDRERQCGEAASSFFSYGNREWCRGEASSAAEKKGRTSINSGQPTNQPLAPYCLKTATILLLHSQFSSTQIRYSSNRIDPGC